MTMWPLAASGGWPLARGQLHSDSVNAQRMRPYMGAVGEGGLIRGGPLYTIGKQWHGGKTAWKYTPAFGL